MVPLNRATAGLQTKYMLPNLYETNIIQSCTHHCLQLFGFHGALSVLSRQLVLGLWISKPLIKTKQYTQYEESAVCVGKTEWTDPEIAVYYTCSCVIMRVCPIYPTPLIAISSLSII